MQPDSTPHRDALKEVLRVNAQLSTARRFGTAEDVAAAEGNLHQAQLLLHLERGLRDIPFELTSADLGFLIGHLQTRQGALT